MKVKIVLKLKQPTFGIMVKGETMVLINDVFDEKTGIAFFPIEKDKWTVLSYDEYTGVCALEGKKKKEIYRGDAVNVRISPIKIYCKYESEQPLT